MKRVRATHLRLGLLALTLLPAPGLAAAASDVPATPAPAEILPPVPEWNGKSRALVAKPDDPWITPCETSGLQRTPRYDETIAWLRRLADAAPEIDMLSLGKSPEGRDIWMMVASSELAFTPETLRAAGKPTLLAQAGIHAGEIDGKDAGMMLLRDLAFGSKRDLLQQVNVLFVPILNVDGHERFGPWSRINQRGPVEMGWRTSARNLNLNRDYTKLDTVEIQHLVRALNAWQPDLYLDLHVTDGADYQYDITWGGNGDHAYSRAIGRWIDRELTPDLERALRDMGHVPGPLIFMVDERDAARGVDYWTASPRFSNGYGDARHLPAVLVENHSLKPFDQRVLGTYVLLEATLRSLAKRGGALRRAIADDSHRRPDELALDWIAGNGDPPSLDFLGVESLLTPSAISGALRVTWTGEPRRARVPHVKRTTPALVTKRPRAYWVPAAWSDVITKLEMHGVQIERLEQPREQDVEVQRITAWSLETKPFEGRVRVTPTSIAPVRRRIVFAPGSARVPTDQPLGDLVMLLLEPESPDSFFQWGFFFEILQRTEYAEAYVLEALAERMLEADPNLRAEFERQLLTDAAFASNPEARLDWFYQRTPYFDDRWRLYPVGRE
jgi:hypothetical protein